MLGRWISRDPIEEEGGLNLYGFVNNNPVNYIDLFGEKVVSDGSDGLPKGSVYHCAGGVRSVTLPSGTPLDYTQMVKPCPDGSCPAIVAAQIRAKLAKIEANFKKACDEEKKKCPPKPTTTPKKTTPGKTTQKK